MTIPEESDESAFVVPGSFRHRRESAALEIFKQEVLTEVQGLLDAFKEEILVEVQQELDAFVSSLQQASPQQHLTAPTLVPDTVTAFREGLLDELPLWTSTASEQTRTSVSRSLEELVKEDDFW